MGQKWVVFGRKMPKIGNLVKKYTEKYVKKCNF
nr:MAG TPA: hypothetical protein [Caudoviricetes sp.]